MDGVQWRLCSPTLVYLVQAQPSAGHSQPAAKKAKAPVGVGLLSGRKKAKSGVKLPKGASSLIGKWQAVQQVRHRA